MSLLPPCLSVRWQPFPASGPSAARSSGFWYGLAVRVLSRSDWRKSRTKILVTFRQTSPLPYFNRVWALIVALAQDQSRFIDLNLTAFGTPSQVSHGRTSCQSISESRDRASLFRARRRF